MLTIFADHFLIFPPTGLVGLLCWVAIVCVIAWGIFALVRWAGFPIPEPVRIVAICLFCIFLILICFRVFAMLL